jgi:hypothetical protein
MRMNRRVRAGLFFLVLIVLVAYLFIFFTKEERGMSFENAYATPQEVERLDIHGIWHRFRPASRGEPFGGNPPEITIDRDAGNFLILVNQSAVDDPGALLFVFVFEKKEVAVYLKVNPNSSKSIDDVPFIRVWDLLRWDAPSGLDDRKNDVITQLKAALNAYGFKGIRYPLSNVKVMFNF